MSHLINFIVGILLWICRVFLKLNRLEKLDMVDLEDTIDKAIELYDEPIEKEIYEKHPEATQYTFEASPYHEVVISEWKGKIHSITYWSSHSALNKDLSYMFNRYGDGKKWKVLEEGYFYIREDNEIMLWCSAAPAIGVGTIKFRDAQTSYKKQLKTEQ